MNAYHATTPAVAAIVCAYNERPRIGAVLQALVMSNKFAEIIVVDDGSTDDTREAVRLFSDVRLIRNPRNVGKGQSMVIGALASTAPIIFFCDADIVGLDGSMLETLLRPVVAGRTEMMVGQTERKSFSIPFVLALAPKLSGVRVVSRRLWKLVPRRYKKRFKIEAALNFVAQNNGEGFQYRQVKGLGQTIKEKKYGFVVGVIERARMSINVLSAYFELYLLGTFQEAALDWLLRKAHGNLNPRWLSIVLKAADINPSWFVRRRTVALPAGR